VGLIHCTVRVNRGLYGTVMFDDPNLNVLFLFQLMYFVFLAYYSYVILFAFRPTITVAEWIVIVWIATMLVEEVRQVNLQAGVNCTQYDRET